MSKNEQQISLALFEAVSAQGLDASAQAALTQAIAKLKVDLVDLGIEVVERPPCEHSLTDDGMFTVACSECGVSVDSTPDFSLIERFVAETKESQGGSDIYEMDDESLTDLLARATSESLVGYVFDKPGK